jgi:DNA-directed RNA polymerase subunit RPC12/RpoP
MSKTCTICKKKISLLALKLSLRDGIACKNCFSKIGLNGSINDIRWAKNKTVEEFKALLENGKDVGKENKEMRAKVIQDRLASKEKEAAERKRLKDIKDKQYKEAREFVHSLPDNTKNRSVSKLESQPHSIINNITVKEQPKEKYSRHAPKCPKCKSYDIQVLDNRHKSFSIGKAAVGGILYGGIGTIAGFAGKDGKKYNAVCMKCGKKFKI